MSDKTRQTGDLVSDNKIYVGVSTVDNNYVGIGTTVATAQLTVAGDINLTSGIITATSGIVTYYGDGSNLTDVTATNVIGGIGSLTSLTVSGISALGTVQISSGIITATSGIVTYYGDGSNLTGVAAETADSFLFNTGITSSVSLVATGIGTTALTLPSTSGKQYIVHSIHASNVATGNTEVNFIGAFDFNGGERSYFAYNIPIPTGMAIELLKQPQVLNPSDKITIRSTDYDRNGIDDSVEVYISYQEKESTDYFGTGLGAAGLAATTPITIYTSSTYPSVVQSIRLANTTDSGAKTISVSVNTGVKTTYLVDNLIVPKYGSIEILDSLKRIEIDDVIQIELDEASSIDVQLSAKKITA